MDQVKQLSRLITLSNLIFVNADIIAKEINPENTTGGKLAAGRVFFKEVNKHINEGKSFAIESTLSGLYFKKLINLAKNKGYIVKLIYIFLDNPEVCIERIKERVFFLRKAKFFISYLMEKLLKRARFFPNN